jgi:hypothetical protein
MAFLMPTPASLQTNSINHPKYDNYYSRMMLLHGNKLPFVQCDVCSTVFTFNHHLLNGFQCSMGFMFNASIVQRLHKGYLFKAKSFPYMKSEASVEFGATERIRCAHLSPDITSNMNQKGRTLNCTKFAKEFLYSLYMHTTAQTNTKNH